MIEKLCPEPSCTSLRRELCTIFGVPRVGDGQTWNEAMLYHITQELADDFECDHKWREYPNGIGWVCKWCGEDMPEGK